MGDAQALLYQQVEKVRPKPAPPVRHARTLVGNLVLEISLAGEILKVRIIDPALKKLFVRQIVNRFQKEHRDHEAGRRGRAPFALHKTRGRTLIKPVPVNLTGQPHQGVRLINELVQGRFEQAIRFLSRAMVSVS